MERESAKFSIMTSQNGPHYLYKNAKTHHIINLQYAPTMHLSFFSPTCKDREKAMNYTYIIKK